MHTAAEPLINDEFTGELPAKRGLAHLQAKREGGKKIAEIYCAYAPHELIRAMDIREDAEDPARALAEYYLKIPCS
ncbi:MAG: hypothetical protein JXA35_05450 [Deltaproteobacteria bacterium]|nr:hypothetical protein [Deltaproteobacteria bacterium]